MFGLGTKSLHIELPYCIKKVIKYKYPEDDLSKYVGFRKLSDDSKRRKI